MESISINNWLWIQWKSHLISFNYLSLPKGVHFTIAFNENSSFINLHLTKNSTQKKNAVKPKIEICRIRKNDFFDILPKLIISLLSHILEEIQEPENCNDYYFISFQEIEKEGIQKGIEKIFFENFKDLIELKQDKRLKIKGKIENRLEKVARNKKIQELVLNKLEIIEQTNNEKFNEGIFLSKNGLIRLLKIHNKWYEFNTEIDVNLVCKVVFGNQDFKQLKEYTTASIKIIEKAKNYQDCVKYNKPFTLKIANASR